MLKFRRISLIVLIVILMSGMSSLVSPLRAAGPMINEFVFNHTGTDINEFVEIYGDPNTDYSSYTIVEIEGDSGQTGLIDDGTFSVGTTDANGLWWTFVKNSVWENNTVTLLLVTGYTGSVGQDTDTDDDGVMDYTPWTSIVDSVAVTDGAAGYLAYSTVVLTPGFDGGTFTPGGASRIPHGTDTDAVSDWMRNDFDMEGLPGDNNLADTWDNSEALNTPNAANQAKGPNAVALSGLSATSPFAALAVGLLAATGLVVLRKRK